MPDLWGPAQANAPADAPLWGPAAPQRATGATGWSAVSQTFHDLTTDGPANHNPNAIEQGIMDVAGSKPVQYLQGEWKKNAVGGLFAEPTRAVMEGVGYGRQQGESDASLHQRYNDALTASRQQADQQSQNNQVGSYGPDASLGDRAARFAQQASGVATGFAANPQYALIPGGNFSGGLATRVAAAGGANALIGSVSDGAAQLMDMAAGVKKDFDIDENLKSAQMGALFGVAAHGAVEAAPFVKQLFAQRGVDTKPSANPTGSKITPLTQDHVPLNQADAMQYQQLLKTGSVDDIKGFFQGRNGPQPSYQDVNDWVEHRDGPHAETVNGQPWSPDNAMHPDFNYEQQYNDHVEQQYNAQNRQAVEDHVNGKMAGWSNAPEVEVVHGPNDIADPAIRANALKEDPNGNALGFLGPDGKVRMYSGRITDPDTASAVLFHEGLGHFGLAEKFGSKLDSTIQSLLDRNVNQFSKDTDAWMKRNPKAYGGDRIRAAEEVLAEKSQNGGPLKPGLRDAITSTVKQFGRKMGLKLAYSDAEVNHVLAIAHDAVINGKSVPENGFQGATQNKNMFIGQKARGFTPNDETAFTASDGQRRNEIPDDRASLLGGPEGHGILSDHLHHPALFNRYPQLRDLPVYKGDLREEGFGGLLGGYDPIESRMYLHNGDLHGHNMRDIVLHETQHAVQHIENQLPEQGSFEVSDEEALAMPVEKEAMATEDRSDWTHEQRVASPVEKFMRTDQLGKEVTDPEQLDQVDRLKADPRFWSDPEFRANVIEMARTRQPVDRSPAPEAAPLRSEAEYRAQNKYMRTGQLNDHFANKMTDEERQDWKARGVKDLLIDWNTAVNQFETFYRFIDQNQHLIGRDSKQLIADFREQGHSLMDQPQASGFLRALSDTTRGPENKLTTFMTKLKDRENRFEQQMNDLHDAKSPGGILENMPRHMIERMNHLLETNGDLKSNWPNRPDLGNKFITRDQLNASSPDYKADDLERIYNTLDENYTPTNMSWEENRQAALKAGFNPRDIAKLKETNPGDLSTRLYRLQAAANLTDTKLAALHERLDTPEWSEKDQADYIQAIADFNYLVPRIKGERAEIARALNVSKAAGSYSAGTMQQMAELLEQHGSGLAHLAFDPTAFLKFARQLKGIMGPAGPNGGPPLGANPAGTRAMLQGVTKPYWEQYLTTFHMNAMLSGLSTHFKAPIDMMTGIGRNVIEKAVAMPVGQIRQTLVRMTGKAPKPGVEAGELAAHIAGLVRAVTDMEVYKAAANAVKTGQGAYVDAAGARQPSNFTNQFGALSNPRIPIVSIPTDLVSAQDTIFRSWEINAQLDSLGYREARDQLGSKASTLDVMTLGHTIASNPTASMLKEAYNQTNRTLLLNDNPLNTLINKGRVYKPGMTRPQRAMASFLGNIAPFIRVESNNLINRIVQRSPLGLLSPDVWKDIKAGGPKADIAISKMLYGTALLGIYWAAADKAKDKLTGEGATSVDKYKEDIAAGRVPNAVHENGGYNTGGQLGMSVNPFDLHNRTAQMVAGVRQSFEEGVAKDNTATHLTRLGTGLKLAMGSLMYNLAESTWVSDIQPYVDAARAHGQEGQSLVSGAAANFAKTWVPNILNQVGRINDSVQRDTTAPDSISGHVGNEIASAVPGMRETLPVKYSVYGNPLPNGASWSGVHTWIPGLSGNGTTETHDPAEKELDRLNLASPKHAVVTPVMKSFKMNEDDKSDYDASGRHDLKIDDEGKVHLTPRQFETYQQRAGRYIVEDVRQEMSTPEWHDMTDQEKIATVHDIETSQKANAKEELFFK